MVLRIEDTDSNRFVPGAEDYICEALDWLGIRFDEGVKQGVLTDPIVRANVATSTASMSSSSLTMAKHT